MSSVGQYTECVVRMSLPMTCRSAGHQEPDTSSKPCLSGVAEVSMALGEMQDGVGKRLDAAEKELGGKAASADLRKLSLELEAYAKREDIQRIQDMATRVHKDAVERLDDLSERTFTLRADMGEKAGQLQAETDAMGKQEDETVEGALGPA